MKALTFDFACRHGGGKLVGISQEQALPPISIDTRTLKPGEIFWTLKGKRDGQEFVFDAIRRGANGVVVSESWWKETQAASKKIPAAWVVPDRLRTLQTVANAWRRELGMPIVAITGSNGKTTTKELVLRTLSSQLAAGGTAGNQNNHIGVPLSLLSLRAEHQVGVIEMGANHEGEIKFLCEMAEPTDGLITSIGRAHLEGFKDIERVAAAKGELFSFLAKDGRAFVPVEDSRCVQLSQQVRKRIGFGFHPRPDEWDGIYYEGKQLELMADACASFRFAGMEVRLTVPGKFWARTALAALTIAAAFGVETARAAEAITAWQGIPGRTQIRRLPDMTFIDDTYNANPESMRVALELLRDLSGKRRIAVLGDMAELGTHAEKEHRDLGRDIGSLKIGKLYCLGMLSQLTAEEARSAGVDAWHTKKVEELIDRLRQDLTKGDTVLFKASRSMALDEVVKALVA